jgi:hypothetical protein
MTADAGTVMRQYDRDPEPTPGAVWVGIVAAPLAWSALLATGWWISSTACADGTPSWGPLPAGAVRTLLVALAAGSALVAAWGLMSAWRAGPHTSDEPRRLIAIEGRQRVGYMAQAGVLVSAFFLFGIALTWMALSVVSVCEYAR